MTANANSLTATLKYALSSEKKMSLVAKMVARKSVADAMVMLQYLPKKAGRILLKVVKSATANAHNNLGIDTKTLYIDRIEVGKGPTLRRVRPASRSRMHGYIKHRAFVKVILATK